MNKSNRKAYLKKLRIQRKMESNSKFTFFRKDNLTFGILSWRIYVFNDLNELLHWYLTDRKLDGKFETLEGKIVDIHYEPVYVSKIDRSHLPQKLNSHCIDRIIKHYTKMGSSEDAINKRLKYLINRKGPFQKLFKQPLIKYYSVAYISPVLLKSNFENQLGAP